MKINEFIQRKQSGQKISMITCYDYTFAGIINETDIDSVLVGDSGTMIMHGSKTTTEATVDEISFMIKGVSRAIDNNKVIVGDMPFLSYRKGLKFAMNTVDAFVRSGANIVKLEGVEGNQKIIKHIIGSGVPVMGHIGLTPQSINALGGYFVQGKLEKDAEKLLEQAKELSDLGCCSIVLECVPSELARIVTETVDIPTVGIGAGPNTDGQVLVLQDMLGMFKDLKPRFVRRYLDGFQLVKDALNHYHREVAESVFPDSKESF
ncbi:MAG: 3-methyl-2-oxobutanoate hydroxymethyltransferase [Victivallales bacterium]|nr:3-methyl-2-oxobutanoate hydroxymethyltransferase [Victivallales bacterium]